MWKEKAHFPHLWTGRNRGGRAYRLFWPDAMTGPLECVSQDRYSFWWFSWAYPKGNVSVFLSIYQTFWASFSFVEFKPAGTSKVEDDGKISFMIILSEAGLVLWEAANKPILNKFLLHDPDQNIPDLRHAVCTARFLDRKKIGPNR
jgi:hypothetical protein